MWEQVRNGVLDKRIFVKDIGMTEDTAGSLLGLKQYMDSQGDKVLYISTDRFSLKDDTKEKLQRQFLSFRLSGNKSTFLEIFNIDTQDPHLFLEPGTGYCSLLNIYIQLKSLSPDEIVLIEDVGQGMHSLWKSAIVPAIMGCFKPRALVVSSWHSEVHNSMGLIDQ